MIELKYLSKTFQMKDGAVKALQNINLTIPDLVHGAVQMLGQLAVLHRGLAVLAVDKIQQQGVLVLQLLEQL